VKVVLDHRTDGEPAGAQPPHPTRPASSPIGPMGQLWRQTPGKPDAFADPHLVAPEREVAHGLAAATTLSGWPDIANASRIEADLYNACDTVADIEPQCVVSPSDGIDPDKVAVVFGDTTMGESYWYLMRAALPRGWTLVGFVLSGCPGAMVTPVRPLVADRSPADCTRHHDAYARVLARWRPALVVLADGEDEPYSLIAGDTVSGAQERAAMTAYRAGLARLVRTASAPGRHVVLLSPPPATRSVASCAAADRTPTQCQQPPYATWFALNAVQRAVAARTGATYADLLDLFCHQLVCPAVVPKDNGTIAVRSNYEYLTPEYAQFVAASFQRYLIRAGLV